MESLPPGEVARVADFRAALRAFLRKSERNARKSGLTPLVRRAEETGLIEREQSSSDGRVTHLRLTEEGERRLMRAFTTNEQERHELRAAIAHLDG